MSSTRNSSSVSRGVLFALVAVALMPGCGSHEREGQLELHPVTGQLTVAGKPAAGIMVSLAPAAGSPAAEQHLQPTGVTDEQGQFAIATYRQADGAPAGEYSVLLRWPQVMPRQAKAMPAGFAKPVDRLKGRFLDPAKSPWHITIVEGENVLDPIAVN